MKSKFRFFTWLATTCGAATLVYGGVTAVTDADTEAITTATGLAAVAFAILALKWDDE